MLNLDRPPDVKSAHRDKSFSNWNKSYTNVISIQIFVKYDALKKIKAPQVKTFLPILTGLNRFLTFNIHHVLWICSFMISGMNRRLWCWGFNKV